MSIALSLVVDIDPLVDDAAPAVAGPWGAAPPKLAVPVEFAPVVGDPVGEGLGELIGVCGTAVVREAAT